MEPTEILMNEHRLIEKALDALEAWVAKLGPAKDSADKAELARFVQFIRGFADDYHHGKEEDILFVAMVEHGFPREAGPIAVMLHEHDLGRNLVGVLDGLAQQATPWSDDGRAALGRTAREFASLLRQHIQKEDQVLYPMARARLPVPVQEEMARRFQTFEEQQVSNGESARLRALGDSLIVAHAGA